MLFFGFQLFLKFFMRTCAHFFNLKAKSLCRRQRSHLLFFKSCDLVSLLDDFLIQLLDLSIQRR